MSTQQGNSSEDEYGLIVQQPGPQQQNLVKSLSLMLNYLYGFNILLARSVEEGLAILAEHSASIRHICVVQDKPLSAVDMSALNRNGEVPLFMLLPGELVGTYQPLIEGLKNTYLLPWEGVNPPGEPSLRERIQPVLEEHGIGGVFDRAQHVSYRVLQQRVEKRLRNLHTLPTLPEVVVRIMEVISDTTSTAEELEEVLSSDPAIVHKLLQVVGTPAFSGAGHWGQWTLKEAIVRLGRRKLGSVALQIKLINSLIKPEESHFALRRFWIHSVGSAHIADKIVSEGLVDLDEEVGVNEYWIASLLHDIGMLVLGFFFWNYFERAEQLMAASGMSFREAEERLGDMVTHQQVGQLLLMRSAMGQEVVNAVAAHHDPDALPKPLLCLVHLADNLCKDLGLGYMQNERGQYEDSVLRMLGLDDVKLQQLRDIMEKGMVEEIMEVVDRCTRK